LRCMWQAKGVSGHRVLIGKFEGMRSVKRLRHRLGIKMDVKKYDGRAWSGFVWYKT